MKDAFLVTGAAGFIGSHLVEKLLDSGCSVIGIDNFFSGVKNNLESAFANPKFSFAEGDIRDREFLQNLFDEHKIKVIFHEAAIASVEIGHKQPELVHEVNVTGTLNLLQTAVTAGVHRCVFASSASVYGNCDYVVQEDSPLHPDSFYAATKLSAETYCRIYGLTTALQVIILRYFNVYGPRQLNNEYSGVISIFVNSALANQPLTIHGTGNQIRDFVSVHDIVKANIEAGHRKLPKFALFNVASSSKTTILQLAEIIQQLTGSQKKVNFSSPRKGDINFSQAQISYIREVLGWEPQISLAEGLKETIEWYENLKTS